MKVKLAYIILFFVLVGLDQLAKYIIRTSGGFYICNPNLAFGLKISQALFLIAGLLLIFLIWEFWRNFALKRTEKRPDVLAKKTSSHYHTGLLFIISGAFSNVIDRISLGCVIDFIDFRIWPVFNLADAFLSAGAIILLSAAFKKDH